MQNEVERRRQARSLLAIERLTLATVPAGQTLHTRCQEGSERSRRASEQSARAVKAVHRLRAAV